MIPSRKFRPGDRVHCPTQPELGYATVEAATPTGVDNQLLTVTFDPYPEGLIQIGAHLVAEAPRFAELGRPRLVKGGNVHPLRPRASEVPPWGSPPPAPPPQSPRPAA